MTAMGLKRRRAGSAAMRSVRRKKGGDYGAVSRAKIAAILATHDADKFKQPADGYHDSVLQRNPR